MSQGTFTSIFAKSKYIIAIVGVLISILCALLAVGAWYFGRVRIYDGHKLSNHLDLEMETKNLSGVLPAGDSDDEETNTLSQIPSHD